MKRRNPIARVVRNLRPQVKPSKKRSLVIAELTRLSRDGWKDAKPCDYEPLERTLRERN